MHIHATNRTLSSLVTLAAVSLSVACSLDDANERTGDGASPPGNTGSSAPASGVDPARAIEAASPTVSCADGSCTSVIASVDGIPFVTGAFTRTDDTFSSTARLRVEPGAVCMTGHAAVWAHVALGLSEDLRPGIPPATTDRPFDAAARGITQIEFTLDSPPSSGVTPSLVMRMNDSACTRADCPTVENFTLLSGGAELSIAATATLSASLTDFDNPTLELDPRRILGIHFSVKENTDYDFCVRDLTFFDPAANVVVPPS
jgi:hypothetical protein